MSDRDGYDSRDRHLFDRVPFGKHHQSVIGRTLWVWWSMFRGLALALIAAVGLWYATRSVAQWAALMAFTALLATMMRGSTYERDEQVREIVREELERDGDG